MAKIFTYVIILVGISLLLKMAGIDAGTGSLATLLSLDSPSGFSLGSFLLNAINVFALSAGAGGIVIGYLVTQSPESAMKAGFISLITTAAVTDMISIITYFNCLGYLWLGAIVELIFFPLVAGFIIAAVEWWGGND